MGTKDDENVVSISPDGGITILKKFREELDISAPGQVSFARKGDDEFVIRPVEESADGEDEEEAISVTSEGEITIPEKYQDALAIETPGRAILDREDDELVIRTVHESLGY